MNTKNISSIIADFHSGAHPKYFLRDLFVPLNSGKIITITGPRRCGKTYYLFQLADNLIKSGVPRNRIIYMNFEDDRLDGIEADDFLNAYHLLYPDEKTSGLHFLFDEIQSLPNWDKYIRRIYDNVTKSIYLTGSNSEVLRDKISTALRGRSVNYELDTLSFMEFLTFKGKKYTDKTTEGKRAVESSLLEYSEFGGFPELIGMENDLKIRVLQEYFNVMIYRDIIEHYEMANANAVRSIMKKAIKSFAKEFSVNKAYNEMKSQGIKISKETVYGLIEKSKSAYFTNFLYKYSSKSNALNEIRKIYLTDIGYAAGELFGSDETRGRKIENIVFNHLRKTKSIYYEKNSYEIDFIHEEKSKRTGIQVTWELNEENVERETNPLKSMLKNGRINKAQLIVMNRLPSKLKLDKKIDFLMLSDYLIG